MPVPFSFLSFLECSRCHTHYNADAPAHLCECGSPLLARYDLDGVSMHLSKEMLRARTPSLWRYHEMLPIRNDDSVVTLGEGMTPLLPLKRIGRKLDMRQLFVKDEGALPTGSFKARGAAVGVSRAKELGVKVFAMPTNGNAGGAWAAYAARAGIDAVIVMPQA
ncbi:MAG: pyridoxal-phosphate dependent enzyme, partial [Ktedonobacteraceae bacterium]|nr:pyridoxal-phosphate dependent enzyme [Ktedonobacteraceae bacterium]